MSLPRLTRGRRQSLVISTLAVLALLSGWGASAIGMLDQTLQGLIYDQFVYVSPRAPGNQVAVIAIDDATIEHYGRWPLPRRAYAETLRVLREMRPSVVAFDVAFLDPSDSAAEDALLASEIKASGNVLLSMLGSDSGQIGPDGLHHEHIKLPLASLRGVAAGLASVNVLPDLDGRVRRIPAVVTDGKQKYFQLAVMAALRHLSADLSKARLTPEGLFVPTKLGERLIPLTADRELYVYFASGPATPVGDQRATGRLCPYTEEVCVISMVDLVQGRVPTPLLQGRAIFIGAHSASAVPDKFHVTTSGGTEMYGVEIHAHTALTVMTERYLAPREDQLTTLLWLLPLTVIGLLLIVQFRLVGFLAGLVLLSGYLVVSAIRFNLAFSEPGLVAVPSIAYVITIAPFWWIVAMGYLLVEESTTVKRTQRTLGFATTPAVARLLLSREESGTLRMVGDRGYATVLFGDIRGFTTMSEGMSPDELLATLNRYFEGMVRIVEEHEGIVNKYNGDNIMVIWNTPVPVERHAEKAVRCALRLQQFIVAERSKGGPDVAFGFGINTGWLSAGLLGSKGRFEYTVIGDTVNVASRLTSGDIARRDQVAISEETLDAIDADIEAIDLGRVKVKGRAEPVACYQVNRIDDVASPDPAPPPAAPPGRRETDVKYVSGAASAPAPKSA